jgi:tetratricopeptide (TPR) repeat protein
MKKTIFTLFIFLLSFEAFTQSLDSIRLKADFYYNNDEFEMALITYNNFLTKDSRDYESFKKRGNCYFNLGNIVNAVKDYNKALLIKPDFSDALFNLGNLYENIGETDSAVYFFKKYSEIRPHEAISYVRLSLLKLTDPFYDSALFYAERAIETEPENFMSYYALAMSYLYLERYTESAEASIKGLSFGGLKNSILYHPLGISYYFSGDYENAYQVFSLADSIEDSSLEYIDYRTQSLLMKNTTKEVYSFKSSGKIMFKELMAENMPQLDKWSKSKDHHYSYSKLISKFHSNVLEMGIDDFFMLYYGFTNDAAYSPYGNKAADLLELWNNKEFDNYLIEAEQLLAKDPTFFGLYWNLSGIYSMNGNKEKQFENLYKYYGFLEGIVASGTGYSPDSAYIVIKISDEYEVLNNFGYILKSQSLINENNKSYDVMLCEDPFGMEKEIYFNIDKAFSKLNLNNKPKKSKRKSKK